MKAVLLVGGLGTRLRSAVPSLPKALASVGDMPFLELLVRQLCNQELRELVMCTGYLADQIQEVFQDGSDFGVTIEYSRERVPLGTAGALRLAQRYVQTESEFLVVNGDTFLEIDFNEFILSHQKHGSVATMAVVRVENSRRYGTVHVGRDGRIMSFSEKTGQNVPGNINAGVYAFSKEALALIPAGPVSLEHDVFPLLIEKGFYAIKQQGMFIDIGTPDDYARAKKMSIHLADAACQKHSRVPPSR
jgi:NDP-sugar pyrophosphorylase family protein